jgi:hypothetical protein
VAFQNINLTTLISLERSRLESSLFWSDAEITDGINDALRFYQLATGRWKVRVFTPTVAKRCIYDLTALSAFQDQTSKFTKILAPIRVVWTGLGGKRQPLGWTSWDDMDAGFPGWQFQTNTTSGCPDTPLACGLFGGLNYLFIWPADAVAGNSLQVDCIATTPVLVTGLDYVNLDSSEIPVLLGYVEHLLSFKLGGIKFQSTMESFVAFLKMCGERNGNLKTLSAFSSVIGADASRRTRPRRAGDATGKPETVGIR